MKKIFFITTTISVLLFFSQCCSIGKVTKDPRGHIKKEIITSEGEIKILLFDQTPLHRDNFVKLSNKKFYNGVLFHRVIKDFMIQTGDPESKNREPGKLYGEGGPGYALPAEFVPELFHKKGAVAAARKGDGVNPKKESSGSQFYIVVGKVHTLDELKAMEFKRQQKEPGFKFSQAAIKAYTTIGGSPHLDGSYTVFGEVLSGIDVVEKISKREVDRNNRPDKDVIIERVK